MNIRIGIVLALATTAWLTGPLTTAAPAAPDRGFAPTKIRVVPAKVLENQPAGTEVGRIVVRDRDRGDEHKLTLVRGKRFFEIVGHSLVTTRPLDHETRPRMKIRLRATDTAGHRFARTLRVRVADVDDPPTAVDDTLTVLEDGGPQPLDVLANDADSDGDGGPRHIASVTQPEHGEVALYARATAVTYDPDPDHCDETATDDFAYTIVYGGSTGTVGVTVKCVQDAPVAVDDRRTTPEDAPLAIPVAGPDSPIGNDVDADGDALTVTAVSGARGGTVVLAPGEIRFSPDADSCGSVGRGFDYTVSDGHGGTDTGTVEVTITCTDDGPGITTDSATVVEDAAATAVDVLANDAPGRSISAVTQPAGGTVVITGGGTGLTYAPDPDFCTAGPADSFTYTVSGGLSTTVAMTVTCVNDAPVADDESFTGSGAAVGNTSLVVDDPTDGAPDPAGLEKTVAGDLLAGDTDAEGAGTLTIAPVTDQSTSGGGRVTIEADGDFTYLPERGCDDTTDTFDYTLRDDDAADPLTDTGTVTIAIADCVWYVDADVAAPAAAIAGTSQAPYVDLAELDSAGGTGDEDEAGEWIFLADGTYSVAARFPFEDDQELHTDRSGLVVDGATLLVRDPTRGRTEIVGGVEVAADNTIQGLDLGAVASFALVDASVGTLVVNTETSGVIDNPVGGAVAIDAADVLDVEFESVETGVDGIVLLNASGRLVVNDGELVGTNWPAVQLTDSPLDLILGADVASGGIAVRMQDSGPGLKDFNGRVSGQSVYLLDNAGATMRFDGGLNLVSGNLPAFTAAGGGTVAVTDPVGAGNNTLDTGWGDPLIVTNTTIHEDDLTFERISSDGAPSGIVLANTGSSGGLSVTGTATALGCRVDPDGCTGGAIVNSVGPGVSLTNVRGGVSLTRMSVGLGNDDGIRATNVAGLEIDDSAVVDNGDALGEGGLDLTDVTGDLTITGSRVLGSADDNLRLSNSSGAASFDIEQSAFNESQSGDGIRIMGDDAATMNVVVDGVTMSGNDIHGLALWTGAGASSPTMNLTVLGSIVNDPSDHQSLGAAQLGIYTSGLSTSKVLIEGTTLTQSRGDGLAVSPTQSADVDMTVRSSRIEDPLFNAVWSQPWQAADLRLRLDDIDVVGFGARGLDLGHGIPTSVGPASTGTASYIVKSSTVQGRPTAGFGLALAAGDYAGDSVWVCADIGGPGAENQLTDAGGLGAEDIVLDSVPSSTLQLPDWVVGGSLPAYFGARNTPLALLDVTAGPPQPVGACLEPRLPPV